MADDVSISDQLRRLPAVHALLADERIASWSGARQPPRPPRRGRRDEVAEIRAAEIRAAEPKPGAGSSPTNRVRGAGLRQAARSRPGPGLWPTRCRAVSGKKP